MTIGLTFFSSHRFKNHPYPSPPLRPTGKLAHGCLYQSNWLIRALLGQLARSAKEISFPGLSTSIERPVLLYSHSHFAKLAMFYLLNELYW
jgi:hypothetical protein